MLRIAKLGIFLFLAVISVAFLEAQQPAEAAPVPAQILTSKKAFVSNAGLDSLFRSRPQTRRGSRSTLPAVLCGNEELGEI